MGDAGTTTTPSTGSVVVVGAYCADCIVATDVLPGWGDDLRVDGVRTRPGGKGLNQAVALARRGVPVRAVGVVGADSTGRDLLADLTAEGVDVTAMTVRPGAATPVCVVLAHSDGRTAFLYRWAPEAELALADLTVARAAIVDARAVIVTFDPPPATVRATVDAALDAGVPLLIHPAPPTPGAAAELLDLPWHRVAALTPNETEARLLLRAAGDPAADGPGPALAGALGARLGAPLVCVTRAHHGVAVWDGARGWERPAHPTTVVDTTAASDVFTAALAHVLFAGATRSAGRVGRAGLVEAAVEAGLAAAAWTVRHRGAIDALPRLAELSSPAGGTFVTGRNASTDV